MATKKKASAKKKAGKTSVRPTKPAESDFERWDAARKLTRAHLKKSGWKHIETLLEDTNTAVREGAASELRQAGAERRMDLAPLVPALVKALKDESVEVRRSAADALNCASEVKGDVAYWMYYKGMDLTHAIPALTEALEDDDDLVRMDAARALKNAAEAGVKITQAMPALTKALEDKDSLVRRHAAGALAYAACQGEDITSALPALGKRLKDGSKDDWEFSARGNSARALIFHSLRKGEWKKIDQSLGSNLVEERQNAARALQIAAWNKVDVSPLIPALSKALFKREKREYGDDEIRWDAARALRYAADNGTDISDAVPNLIQALSDPFTIVIDNESKHIIRRNASAALTTHYINKNQWKSVEGLLKHKDEEVKRGAGLALNKAAGEGKEIPTQLHGFLSAENLVHRHADKKERERIEGLLRRDEPWTNIDIARALVESARKGLDISSAISDFIGWLSAKDAVLRKNAAETLGDAAKEGLDIASAIPGLAQLLFDEDQFVIQAACGCLVAHYINRKDWANIEQLLSHESDGVREGAVKAFEHVRTDISVVIPALAHVLSDKNKSMRLYAALALENAVAWTESDISSVIRALKKALEDEDRGVRDIAKMAWEKIRRKGY